MKHPRRTAPSVLIALIAASIATPALASDRQAAESAIRTLDREWSAELGAKNLDGVMRVYAEDAVLLAPNQPIVVGKQGIREWFQERFATPGYSASFVPNRVVVSESLDMAYETGAFEVSWTAPDGETMWGVGKHLVTWERRDGAWRVTAESISTDGPAKPAGRNPHKAP